MTRCLLILAAALLLGSHAAAQQNAAIRWSLNVEQSVAQAQRAKWPLMFWVLGRSSSRDERIERDQKRAFRDPLVAELSSRFVTVRLSRSRHRDLLEQWGLPPRTNLEIVFVTPAGEKIDTLAPQGVANADVLTRKMTLVFRHYRQQMFEQEIKPKLEDEETSDEDLRSALGLVAKFLILSADQSVVKVLEGQSLSATVRGAAYDTLAALSTSASVKALLERVTGDERAAAALTRCTPAAAEQMLAALDGEDPDQRLIVYRAVTRICRVHDVKADRFWQGRIESLKQKEIDRVRRIVAATAKRWRERYAEYR
ncbi:MAG: hypothetical protein ACE5I3_09820 [Phycisphaerae bacterium]